MRNRNNGFSLIELVIALAILAAATTVAIRATSNLASQARYQATTRSLNDIQASIVGPTNQRSSDGTALFSGFVADTGRLPLFYISPSDPLAAAGDPLTELTANPNGIAAYGTYSSNVDPTVKVGVGWQGPYIRLGAGPTYIRDGWGNSFLCFTSTGGQIPTTGTGTPIAQIASQPATGQAQVSVPYSTISTTGGFSYLATIMGQVTMNVGSDGGGPPPSSSGPTPNVTDSAAGVSIWVDYFGPDLTQSPHPVGDNPYLVVVQAGTSTPTNPQWVNYYNGSTTTTGAYIGQFVISGTNVTMGPRVIKAYVLSSTVTTVAAFRTAVTTGGTSVLASTTLNVTLSPGTQTINLVLPHYSP